MLRPIKSHSSKRSAWFLFCSYFVLAFVIRLPVFFDSVVDWDESIYLLVSDDVLRGYLPYDRVWDHKPPGIFYLFAAAQICFGSSVIAIRLLAVAATAVGGFLVQRLSRRAFGEGPSAYLAGVLYILLTAVNAGLATNTEILFGAFTLLGYFLAWESLVTGRTKTRCFLAGVAFGAGFSIKPVVAFDLIAFAVWFGIVVALLGKPWRESAIGYARAGAIILTGFVATLVACVLPHLVAGKGSLLYETVVIHNLTYASGSPDVLQVAMGLRAVLVYLGPLLCLAAMVVIIVAKDVDRRIRVLGIGVIVWFGLGVLSVVTQEKYFPHHFVQVAGPLSLAFAFFCRWLAERLDTPGLSRRIAVGSVFALTVAAGPFEPLALEVKRFCHHVFTEKDVHYEDTPLKVAESILRESGPGASVYVFNDQCIIYHLVDTLPPTRFAFVLHLLREADTIMGVDRRSEFLRILSTRPEWIVVHEDAWEREREFYAILEQELVAHYQEFERFPVYYWDTELYRVEPEAENAVVLYRRRADLRKLDSP